MSVQELAEMLAGDVGQYEPAMGLHVSRDGRAVTLMLTDSQCYGEWIEGEGADICLYRDLETGRVVGCRLPLLNERLVVHHDGPIRINSGFRKGDAE